MKKRAQKKSDDSFRGCVVSVRTCSFLRLVCSFFFVVEKIPNDTTNEDKRMGRLFFSLEFDSQ